MHRQGYPKPKNGQNGNQGGNQGNDNGNNSNGNNSNDNQARRVAPARLIVQLPAEARLLINGRPTRSTSPRRVFTSPPLRPGRAYYYTLKATLNRDGKTEVARKRVRVRAGRISRVRLKFPEPSVAQR
jgi:uncharacterized protein (TIGR03000 family)